MLYQSLQLNLSKIGQPLVHSLTAKLKLSLIKTLIYNLLVRCCCQYTELSCAALHRLIDGYLQTLCHLLQTRICCTFYTNDCSINTQLVSCDLFDFQ